MHILIYILINNIYFYIVETYIVHAQYKPQKVLIQVTKSYPYLILA